MMFKKKKMDRKAVSLVTETGHLLCSIYSQNAMGQKYSQKSHRLKGNPKRLKDLYGKI